MVIYSGGICVKRSCDGNMELFIYEPENIWIKMGLGCASGSGYLGVKGTCLRWRWGTKGLETSVSCSIVEKRWSNTWRLGIQWNLWSLCPKEGGLGEPACGSWDWQGWGEGSILRGGWWREKVWNWHWVVTLSFLSFTHVLGVPGLGSQCVVPVLTASSGNT